MKCFCPVKNSPPPCIRIYLWANRIRIAAFLSWVKTINRLQPFPVHNLVSPLGRDVAQRQRGLAPSYVQTKLVSPSGRDVAQRQRGLAPSLRELDLPQAKTEGVLQIDKIRIGFALIQTCSRAAPSVTAYAVPPSSKRKASRLLQASKIPLRVKGDYLLIYFFSTS